MAGQTWTFQNGVTVDYSFTLKQSTGEILAILSASI
jgi:hypothetical protein